MLFNVHQIKVMKVALALAIIRQKPKGMSVREFIGRLKVITSDCQVDWKAKAEKVSEELLELKQNVLVKQIVLQQDSQNAQPELLGELPPAEGTSLRQNPLPLSLYMDTRTDSSTARHLQFIKLVSMIKNIDITEESPVNSRETIKDTIVLALEGITNMMTTLGSSCANVPLKSDTMTSTIDIILGIIQDKKMSSFRETLIQSCKKLNAAILFQLTAGSIISGCDCWTLQLMIKSLSSLHELYSESLRAFIKCIVDSILQLAQALKDPALLDPELVNNLGTSLRCAEILIVDSHHEIPYVVQQQLIEAVEGSLFEVDAVLPLVGFSVWRLHALLVQTE